MSTVPTIVDTEYGDVLHGVELTPQQKTQLYIDGFLVLRDVVSRQLTREARRRVLSPTENERASDPSSSPCLADCINKSRLRPLLQSLIGDFDPPQATQVAFTSPAAPVPLGQEAKNNVARPYQPRMQRGFNHHGHPEQGYPFYNAQIHNDGIATYGVVGSGFQNVGHQSKPQEVPPPEVTDQEIYWRCINGPWSSQPSCYNGSVGRHAENYRCGSQSNFDLKSAFDVPPQ